MVLVDIIDILAKNYTIHLGVDGYIVGVFNCVDDIPYKYLRLRVKRVYPGAVENENEQIDGVTGLDPLPPKAFIGLDLETMDHED